MLQADSTSTALQSKNSRGTHAAESAGQNLCPSDMYLFQIHTCEPLQSITDSSIHYLIINPCFRKQCSCSPRDSWGLTDSLGDKIIWAVLYIHPWQGPCLIVPFVILLTFYCSLHFTVQLRDYSLIGCALYSPLPHCSNKLLITFYSSLHFSVNKGSFNSTVLFASVR